jgi:ribonuclease HI
LEFNCTNNIAEYEVVLLGLQKLRAMGIRRAFLKSDSQVITWQVDKSSKARDPKLEKYLDTVQRMEASFQGFSVKTSEEEKTIRQIYYLNQWHRSSHSPQKCSSKLTKHLRSSSWSERYLRFHLCKARIGEQKLYVSSKVIIFG